MPTSRPLCYWSALSRLFAYVYNYSRLSQLLLLTRPLPGRRRAIFPNRALNSQIDGRYRPICVHVSVNAVRSPSCGFTVLYVSLYRLIVVQRPVNAPFYQNPVIPALSKASLIPAYISSSRANAVKLILTSNHRPGIPRDSPGRSADCRITRRPVFWCRRSCRPVSVCCSLRRQCGHSAFVRSIEQSRHRGDPRPSRVSRWSQNHPCDRAEYRKRD